MINTELLSEWMQEHTDDAPAKPVKISFRNRQGYSKDIGYWMSGDGKRVSKRFWLGHDQARAVRLAGVFTSYFERVVKPAGGLWDEKHLRFVSLIIDGEDQVTRVRAAKIERKLVELANRTPIIDLPLMKAPVSARSEPITTTAEPKAATLYAAVDAYIESLKGKRVSIAHKWRADQVLNTSLKAIRKDCPLADIDMLWLDRLADHWKARPKTDKTGKAMRPETVVTTLRYLKTFFNWIDDTGFGGWVGPRKLMRPFRVRAADLMTPTELREAATIVQFDIPTLVKLYRAGSHSQKLWMLTALFTGGTQMELSVLTKDEFDLDAGTLEHYRNKTRIVGKFWLPSELVTLLKVEFKRNPRKPLAMYTADGNPVVWFRDNKIVADSVRLSWDRLRIKAEVPDAPSFKYLRKFAGDYAVRHGGEAMGQIALSHSRSTVLARNYTTARDFDTFNEIQRKMHAEFVAAGMFSDTKAT